MIEKQNKINRINRFITSTFGDRALLDNNVINLDQNVNSKNILKEKLRKLRLERLAYYYRGKLPKHS